MYRELVCVTCTHKHSQIYLVVCSLLCYGNPQGSVPYPQWNGYGEVISLLQTVNVPRNGRLCTCMHPVQSLVWYIWLMWTSHYKWVCSCTVATTLAWSSFPICSSEYLEYCAPSPYMAWQLYESFLLKVISFTHVPVHLRVTRKCSSCYVLEVPPFL